MAARKLDSEVYNGMTQAMTAAAADCVLKAIDQRDRELESLSRSASPSEANRL